ncbi:thiamine phosphate synthase [Prochlorothrix hollandica]|uniref:Thiamine-phosphate synthase n=1 Tax=Prochlorothrix hollandica PCC 9006 = CALU 1027 TaxID=317619 RepID=A0A0M2PX72_PROHO|nr:thiamine phosphate synthase [Prochlorothrix hollandica]KKI99692.1 thiamine-phosphate pyrophosphorylase [Prochlorothrix hollandica PCC 9006 = CALU 1027]
MDDRQGQTQGQTQLYQPALYRILDANLDRVREGLRIIEEWCRFGLNHTDLTAECKALRQETAQWHHAALRAARDTATDPGTRLTHAQEAERSSIQQVLQANFCRVEEAMRVLEEYGKLYDGKMGSTFKQLRYRVYQLESQILSHERSQKLLRSQLYLVTSPVANLEATVEAALQGGLALVQYRAKDEDDVTRMAKATQLRELCHRYGALFIVNDRVDLALAANADGVHLGQQDVPLALARQVLGPNRLVGRSTTNPDELQRAIAEGADYVGVGPVHETPTKPGKAAAGLDYVRYAAEHCPIPWFAIGSINPTNLREVLESGGQRVAVVRSIMEADQPTLVTQYFLSQLQRH